MTVRPEQFNEFFFAVHGFNPFPWQERRGLSVYRYALEHGALLRPLGDVIYFMPPYVIKPEEIDFLAKVAREGIDRAVA